MVKLFHVGIVSICLATMSAWGMGHNMENLSWKDARLHATAPIDISMPGHFGGLNPRHFISTHSHSAPVQSFVPLSPAYPNAPKPASPAKRSASLSQLSCPNCHVSLAAALVLTKPENKS